MAYVKTVRTHSLYFIKLVAEPMEPIHAELFRLATELEAARDQVKTECNALRDLFARTTTALSSSGSRRETEPHGSWKAPTTATRWKPTARFGWRALAAVLTRDGQGGALLREVPEGGEGPDLEARRQRHV